ncbi:MAG: methyltransferase domain-containing protein [Acidobacteria bacterium]|nr:methyltransferase domain-containing protein [Acidobacteriota bacterium]
MPQEAQSLAVKRAQVEFHNFASLGEPERALRVYAEENVRRGAVIRNHLAFLGEMTPYLEIGANAGHSSYMLSNEFGADGFASDISADSLRHGVALMDKWGLQKAPVRVTADALHLPFADSSLRCVMAFQMLSQFMNIESIFIEVKRVLAPGGVFLFAEEPLRRKLSLRLYRCPYWDTMKPWERKLYEWGLLGYLVRDVIGAAQEEGFGIRQNHSMELHHWHQLIARHFPEHEFELFVPERGWGERIVKNMARKVDKHGSDWVPARLLGGTLAAACKKPGTPVPVDPDAPFESRLQCPDCGGKFRLDTDHALRCMNCDYVAPMEGGVYNLLRSADKKELYPGDREDVIDFSLPSHAKQLGENWYELEGVYGNKYRWIGARATATLTNLRQTPQRLRIRGHAHAGLFATGTPPQISVTVNGTPLRTWTLERTGLFILEADVPDAPKYDLEINASPTWEAPPDDRIFTVNLSMIRLDPRD